MINEQVPIKEFTLTDVIKNYHELRQNQLMVSENVDHFNVPWATAYYKDEHGLSLYLSCSKEDKDKEWSIDTNVEFYIISAKGNWKKSIQSLNVEFNNNRGSDKFGIDEFVSNNEMKDDFLVRNEVVVEIKVQILRMSGIDNKQQLKSFDDEEAEKLSDMTLCVDDKRFHVSKLFLASQSTHFSSIISEKARKRKFKVTLDGIDANTFQTFLEVMYLEPTLTDSCVIDVTQLSIKYDSKKVTGICEDFLIHKSKISTKQKIRIAIEFNLENLKKSCIGSLKSAADVRAVLGRVDSTDNIKDPQVLKSIILKSLSFR
ncbi:unnamed protein product [Caenorhabditis brenneri]